MIFFKKKTVEKFACPMSGTLVAIEEVSDPVFSSKSMGDGFAIQPEDGVLKAPFDAEIMVAFPTGHAYGLKSNKYEVLIHVGIDTVMLNGQGFQVNVKAGDHVKKGDVLATVDLNYLIEQGKDTTTCVIFTSGESVQLKKHKQKVAALEEDIIQIK
ncbi:MAG: PTS glucose transporter subunit IIA [Erysipelotrichaceae bacterium]|nr:PTS glucose transporter subunit IIA [Erysipelotrichaceae bacterium]